MDIKEKFAEVDKIIVEEMKKTKFTDRNSVNNLIEKIKALKDTMGMNIDRFTDGLLLEYQKAQSEAKRSLNA